MFTKFIYSTLFFLFVSCSNTFVLKTKSYDNSVRKINLKDSSSVTLLTGWYSCRKCVKEVYNYYLSKGYKVNLILSTKENLWSYRSVLKDYELDDSKNDLLTVRFLDTSKKRRTKVYRKYFVEPSPVILFYTDTLLAINYSDFLIKTNNTLQQ